MSAKPWKTVPLEERIERESRRQEARIGDPATLILEGVVLALKGRAGMSQAERQRADEISDQLIKMTRIRSRAGHLMARAKAEPNLDPSDDRVWAE